MSGYEVRVVMPLSDSTVEHVTTEADALAAALRLVARPRVEQVTIEATPDGARLDTFAVRHVKPTPCPHDCARFGGKVPGHKRGSNWDWKRSRVNTAIRFDADVHARLVEAADERDLTVNWMVNRAVSEFLDRLLPVAEFSLTRKEPS